MGGLFIEVTAGAAQVCEFSKVTTLWKGAVVALLG